MFSESVDDEQIIERVAAIDIGKAELVCCVRLPGKGSRKTPAKITRRSTSLGGTIFV